MVLDWNGKSDTDYGILNVGGFSKGLVLSMVIGTVFPSDSQGHLSLSEHMIQWPTGLTGLVFKLSQCFHTYINNKNKFPIVTWSVIATLGPI